MKQLYLERLLENPVITQVRAGTNVIKLFTAVINDYVIYRPNKLVCLLLAGISSIV
jgi:hypothetical protein